MDRKRDVLQATRLDSGRSTTVNLMEQVGEDNTLLGGEKKNMVNTLIGSESRGRRSIDMVRKEVSVAGGADKYYWAWKKLKDAGVPTVPTVRKINDNEVIMTDMTADGSAFFGKADVSESFVRKNASKLRNLDKMFLDIDLDEVKAKARVIASEASLRGVNLPYDDPMDLLVHPDGSWEIIVLDIDSQMDGHAEEWGWNNRAISKFYRHLDDVKRGLSVGGEPPMIIL